MTGLGRRAKYLLADLSSGDVLLMHLGMSGSFQFFASGDSDRVGRYSITNAPSMRPTITSCFICPPAPS